MPSQTIEAILKSNFGFTDFRPGQRDAINSLLAGKHTLIVMPTGSGKSLIFQLAGLQLEDLTLVISPLIALMKDQVDGLLKRGIPATFINSALSSREQTDRLDRLSHGDYRFVYIAPERLRSSPFLQALKKRTVSLLAIDEAHCISEWGHDFRPDYLYIDQARATLGNPLTAALTATATPKVQSDIIHQLGLIEVTRVVTGFNRPNLTLNVRYTNGIPSKLQALSDLLSPHEPGAAIIYSGTRRDAEEVADFMHEVVKIPASYYHAGFGTEERTRIQNEFISGKLNAIVATNAFGMGIDRADVRQVIHYNLPGSLEAYYQEVGRAGRDGEHATATLLYDPRDRALQEFFIASSIVSSKELYLIYGSLVSTEEIWITSDDISRCTDMHPVKIKVGIAELECVGAVDHLADDGFHMLLRKGKWDENAIKIAAAKSKEFKKQRQDQLDHMIRYAESNFCRRKIILNHFGDHAEPVATICCDNCILKKTDQVTTSDADKMNFAEQTALIILDTVCTLGIRQVGFGKLSQILKGSKAHDIIKFHYDTNKYYARLVVLKQSQIEGMIRELVSLGYLKIIGGQYPVVSLSSKGETAIRQNSSIKLKILSGVSIPSAINKKNHLKGVDTLEFTRQLIERGLSPEQIGPLRDLKITTIYGHCAKLIEAEKIDVQQVLPINKCEMIEKAIQQVGPTQYLWPIKDLLPDEITYEMIRCVVVSPKTKKATEELLKGMPSNHSSQNPPQNKIDPVKTYLSSSHPRSLNGNWQTGYALDFHSSFTGADWNRSKVGNLVFRLKYQSDSSALPALILLTGKLFNDHPEMNQFDMILPVPSSTIREFDPIQEYCKALANAFNKPVRFFLVKTRRTKPQKEIHTLSQKRDNVAGAFGLKGIMTSRRILLVDDLFDSGATMEEITRLLMKNGAACVNILTLTRTIHSDL